MYIKKDRSLIFIIFVFIFTACGAFQGERTYSKNGLMVTYRSLNRFGSEIQNFRIQHPIKISIKMAKNHLQALWYRKIDPPGKAKPVFVSETVDNLSSLIVQAFKKVKPGKYLHFEFQALKGTTAGDVFASKEKIHWRILKINGIDYSNDPLRLRKPTWKLVRTHGQIFKKVSTGGTSKKSQKNWILADLKLPETKRRPKAPSNKDINKRKNKDYDLKQKLKTLKNLFEEGLINRMEYQRKRARVLEKNL